MTASTYHVRKISLGLKRKYRLSADDGAGQPGALVGYAEKQLKAADEIIIYRDEERTEQIAVVRESSAGFVASLTGYEVIDNAGECLGTFGVLPRKSVERTTWQFDQPTVGRLTGTERSLATARVRRLIGLFGDAPGQVINAVIKYHFDFVDERGGVGFSIEKPKVLDDWYRITVHDQSIDDILLLALAITMEARQRG
ncbi:hypothetical protein [Microlunatus soli]|uniref:Scramblase n=1 Tax=Microlunatus soli TaxID=630515 RepID=A0A1H1QHG0_9ACTN|nr:hypothetical protein [Microlunatus soli]SDS22824.1 hypothetical protein SAMN04489812_1272 [Microlunatus soli]